MPLTVLLQRSMVFFAILLLTSQSAFSVTTVHCGDIIEGEFTSNKSTHEYHITMEPGSILEYATVPIGDFLTFYTKVIEPSGNEIYKVEPYYAEKNLKVRTGTLSARGNYQILLHNHNAGIYTLHVGCILKDGTEVKPGSSLKPAPPASENAPPPPLPAALPRLKLDVDLEGVLEVQGSDFFGFQFAAAEGAQVELRFARMSGNLGLTLTLLDPGDSTVFETRLLANQTLTTDLTLPAAGNYRLTVHRTEPQPPSPEATSFRIAVAQK